MPEVGVADGPQGGGDGPGVVVEQLLHEPGPVAELAGRRVPGCVIGSPAAASPARKPNTRAGPSVAPPAAVAVPKGLAAALPAA